MVGWESTSSGSSSASPAAVAVPARPHETISRCSSVEMPPQAGHSTWIGRRRLASTDCIQATNSPPVRLDARKARAWATSRLGCSPADLSAAHWRMALSSSLSPTVGPEVQRSVKESGVIAASLGRASRSLLRLVRNI